MFCRIPTTPVPKETRTRLSRLMTLYVSRLLRVTNIKGNAAPHIMVVKAKMMMNLAGDLVLVGETGLVMELRARKNSNAACEMSNILRISQRDCLPPPDCMTPQTAMHLVVSLR